MTKNVEGENEKRDVKARYLILNDDLICSELAAADLVAQM